MTAPTSTAPRTKVTEQDIRHMVGGKERGNVCCPAHDDKTPSLSVNTAQSGAVMLHCKAGCKTGDILAKLDLTFADISPTRERGGNGHNGNGKYKIVTVYDYPRLDGKIEFQVERRDPKDFRPRRSDGNGGYIYNLEGTAQIPFNLSDVDRAIKAGRTISDTEGEKDAINVAKILGDAATTTNQGGATNHPAITANAHYFKGGDMAIWPDNDEPGRKRAIFAARAYIQAGAKRVRIVTVPAPHKDVSDWIAAGATAADIQAAIDSAVELPEYLKRLEALKPEQKPDPVAPEGPRFVYRFMSADKLKDVPPPKPLIEGLMIEGSYVLLYGRSGIGKSFLALDMALTLAQQHCVIYLAQEGQYRYADDVAAWCNHHKRGPGNLMFLDLMDPQVTGRLPLCDDTAVQALIEGTKPLSPKLIIVDTLAWSLGGGDVNSTGETQKLIENCWVIQRQTGAAIMLIHHTNKGGEEFNGSINLYNGADTVIKLSEDDGVLSFVHEKFKYGKLAAKRYFSLIEQPSRDDRTSQVVLPTTKVVRTEGAPTVKQMAVLEKLDVIFKDNGARFTDLLEAIPGSMSKSSLHSVLANLKKRGFVRVDGTRHFITEDGTNAYNAAASSVVHSRSNQSIETELNWIVPQVTEYEKPQPAAVVHQFTASSGDFRGKSRRIPPAASKNADTPKVSDTAVVHQFVQKKFSEQTVNSDASEVSSFSPPPLEGGTVNELNQHPEPDPEKPAEAADMSFASHSHPEDSEWEEPEPESKPVEDREMPKAPPPIDQATIDAIRKADISKVTADLRAQGALGPLEEVTHGDR